MSDFSLKHINFFVGFKTCVFFHRIDLALQSFFYVSHLVLKILFFTVLISHWEYYIFSLLNNKKIFKIFCRSFPLLKTEGHMTKSADSGLKILSFFTFSFLFTKMHTFLLSILSLFLITPPYEYFLAELQNLVIRVGRCLLHRSPGRQHPRDYHDGLQGRYIPSTSM